MAQGAIRSTSPSSERSGLRSFLPELSLTAKKNIAIGTALSTALFAVGYPILLAATGNADINTHSLPDFLLSTWKFTVPETAAIVSTGFSARRAQRLAVQTGSFGPKKPETWATMNSTTNTSWN